MTKQEQPEPSWTFDPMVRFDRIHIVESLGAGFAGRSGLRLFDALQDMPSVSPANLLYHDVQSKAAFEALMLTIVSEAEAGHFPLLHLEAHGEERRPGLMTTSRGIVLASRELMSWKELAPYLIAINKATRLRLLVFVATCFGADVLTLIQPLERAPASVLVGPRESISMGQLEIGALAFYRSLFLKGNGSEAVADMQQATDGAFLPFAAVDLFLIILRDYYNELTTEKQIAARVENVIVQLVLQGVPSAQIDVERRRMKAHLQNRQAVFDAAYRKFFFIDEHPEIAQRFQMTYPGCFTESQPAADD